MRRRAEGEAERDVIDSGSLWLCSCHALQHRADVPSSSVSRQHTRCVCPVSHGSTCQLLTTSSDTPESGGGRGGCYRHTEGRIKQLTSLTRWVHSDCTDHRDDRSVSETNYAKIPPSTSCLQPPHQACETMSSRQQDEKCNSAKVEQVTLRRGWL